MKVRNLHSWDVSPKEAVTIQRELSLQIKLSPFVKTIHYAAGADISYDRNHNILFSSVLVFEYPLLNIVEIQSHVSKPNFPYVPGLLSFRELPPLLECFKKLTFTPDIILCDGQGYAHPRRFGLACHLGLLLDRPTIGCAKSRLTGKGKDPGVSRGSAEELMDNGELIGYIVRTKDNVKPLFVSPGHLITAEASVQIVLGCHKGYRLPEPTRLAHLEVNKNRIRFLKEHNNNKVGVN
ncbi:deoxyribonuclease V [candidate division KSB1 bacterium]|nr:deoxyribonuclease V [candidate division KSB1 bacterium]